MFRKYKNISIRRFRVVLLAIFLVGVYIQYTAVDNMVNRADYWEKVSQLFVADSVPIEAMRGNILSCDGQVMVASLPEYIIKMDYVVVDKQDTLAAKKAQAWRDSAFVADVDSIAEGLAKIFPDKSKEWFTKRLWEGKREASRAWIIYPRHTTYLQYKACKQLPLFRETDYKGGFYATRVMQRKKPFGSLASRTLGDVYKDSDAAKSGLEWCYDTILRGKNGFSHRKKVRNRKLEFVDVEPTDGNDLLSTIDPAMQDMAEKAIVNKLKEIGGDKGVVILMEAATGDIKAIVSMTRCRDTVNHVDRFYEIQNDAINALWEPGSTFKTGSIMVALEDGYITPNTRVDCAGGIYMMHGRPMKDHNWSKGGYGELTVTEILGQSSNIGVSRIIDQYYHNDPDKFVRGLNREGVGIDLGLPMGTTPRVRHPKKDGSNWSKTALAWMSIGYETALPPISTVTFYNAIANGGKMVRPRFVKAEMKDGRIVKEYPVVTIKEKICSDHTLKDIQMILEKVVSEGLGKKAGNKRFPVSGKTGTAQVAKNGSYASRSYMVSFCGYFPSNDPKYTCLVCIRKDGLPASGGGQCGPVFSEISQFVMNQGVYRDPSQAADSASIFRPDVKKTRMEAHTLQGVVPDVEGMGAKDAVFLLQEAGMKVRMHGTGRVYEQSIPAGTRDAKGKTITINLK